MFEIGSSMWMAERDKRIFDATREHGGVGVPLCALASSLGFACESVLGEPSGKSIVRDAIMSKAFGDALTEREYSLLGVLDDYRSVSSLGVEPFDVETLFSEGELLYEKLSSLRKMEVVGV